MARNLRKLKSNVLDVQMAGWLAGAFVRTVLPVLLCSVFSITSTQATVSGETGTIEGHAPTFTPGLLDVLRPDGVKVEDGSYVSAFIPVNKFLAGGSELSPLLDEDGDTGLQLNFAQEQLEHIVTSNGREITGSDLNLTASDLGIDSFKIKLRGPVTVSSQTGIPNVSEPIMQESRELTLLVNYPLGVKVNGSVFSATSFPTNIFKGAEFKILMNGSSEADNALFTFVSDTPWLNVDATGEVSVVANPPTGAMGEITMTLKSNPSIQNVYRFSPKRLFFTDGVGRGTAAMASYCSNMGGELAPPKYLSRPVRNMMRIGPWMTTQPTSPMPPRDINAGTLYDEWGGVNSKTYPKATELKLDTSTTLIWVGKTSEGEALFYPPNNSYPAVWPGSEPVVVTAAQQEAQQLLIAPPLTSSSGILVHTTYYAGVSAAYSGQIVLLDRTFYSENRVGLCSRPL